MNLFPTAGTVGFEFLGLDVLMFVAGPKPERHLGTVDTWNLLLGGKVGLMIIFGLILRTNQNIQRNIHEYSRNWSVMGPVNDCKLNSDLRSKHVKIQNRNLATMRKWIWNQVTHHHFWFFKPTVNPRIAPGMCEVCRHICCTQIPCFTWEDTLGHGLST